MRSPAGRIAWCRDSDGRRDRCFRLLAHSMRLAADRTACTAGRINAMRMPMMARTMRSSTRVKASRLGMVARRRPPRLSGF
jgi:hypothetical protein